MKRNTRDKLCAIVLEMIDGPGGSAGLTMSRVADAAGITPMAIYKHFPNRDALLKAATATEYKRIAHYFERANARKPAKGLHGMLGYLDYALEHPNLFQYMFSSARADAYTFPDPSMERAPTFGILRAIVQNAMDEGRLRKDDALETALSIWAFAHGLTTLYLVGRIKVSKGEFRRLYLRSLDRLLDGLSGSPRV